MAGWFGFIRVTSEKEQNAVAKMFKVMPKYSGLFYGAGTATMDIADPHPPANSFLDESQKGFKKGDLVALFNIINENDPLTLFIEGGVESENFPYHQELSNFDSSARSDSDDPESLLIKGLKPLPNIEAWHNALTSENLKLATLSP
jgi:hypothetical protein